MSLLEDFINNLLKILLRTVPESHGNVVRIHDNKLEFLGDCSFPLNPKNWANFIKPGLKINTILDYSLPDRQSNEQLKELIERSNGTIHKAEIIKENVHLFFARSTLFSSAIQQVLHEKEAYSYKNVFLSNIQLIVDDALKENLTSLRTQIIEETAKNLISNFPLNGDHRREVSVRISSSKSNSVDIFVGPVLNEKGLKSHCTAKGLLENRAKELCFIALHRFRVSLDEPKKYENYFQKLAKASITIEFLSNKPQKPCKISGNYTESCHKGSAFIFYNCARLHELLKQFNFKVNNNLLPGLIESTEVKWSLLEQSEEWELLFVCILQYPGIVQNAIKDIEKGFFNPQHLIRFLSQLSRTYSVYYRRVRILTEPKNQQLIDLLHARIYLLQALKQVLVNCLKLLNIEPIEAM